jgi:flagellar motor switch protein FliN/FliY
MKEQNNKRLNLGSLSHMPVQVSVVLGRSKIKLNDLLQMAPGSVIELDKNVNDLVEIFVNEKLIARGEIVVVEDKVGVTIREILEQ